MDKFSRYAPYIALAVLFATIVIQQITVRNWQEVHRIQTKTIEMMKQGRK